MVDTQVSRAESTVWERGIVAVFNGEEGRSFALSYLTSSCSVLAAVLLPRMPRDGDRSRELAPPTMPSRSI